MIKFLLKRLSESVLVMIAVSLLTFVLIRLAPGGPFDSDRAVSPQVMENLNARYNLDAPILEQYTDYMVNIVTDFDFGPSFKFPNRSVHELIGSGFPKTLELAFYSLLVALLLGLTSGILAALFRNTWKDYVPMTFAMLGISIPNFFLGPLLVLLFGGALAVAGWETPVQKILPSLTLGSAYAAYVARLSRSSMLDIMNQDFIRTARAKGLSEFKVVTKHALKGGLFPVISFLGPATAGLIAGSFVVESIFQVPGLGRFYVEAAFNRDYTMIMGTTIFFSALIVVFNLIVDIALILLNPRMSFKGAK